MALWLVGSAGCKLMTSSDSDDKPSDQVISGTRNVLVEMFTNIHCPVCAGVHASIDQYSSTSPNASRVNTVYYHLPYPYPNEPLFLANTAENSARNEYYGGASSTPRVYLDGSAQSGFSASAVDTRIGIPTTLEISLSGTADTSQFTVQASIQRSGGLSPTDLVIHFIAVETVDTTGNNGVSPQHNVMRKMITGTGGEPFSIGDGETATVSKSVTVDSTWIPANLRVIVFVQSAGSKEVVQSASIAY